jgi:hypothetical protein
MLTAFFRTFIASKPRLYFFNVQHLFQDHLKLTNSKIRFYINRMTVIHLKLGYDVLNKKDSAFALSLFIDLIIKRIYFSSFWYT